MYLGQDPAMLDQVQTAFGIPEEGYTPATFESDVSQMQPRAFDTYVLPAFLMFFAVKARKPMGRLARRILFTAGVYMAYRNYASYKTLVQALVPPKGEENAV